MGLLSTGDEIIEAPVGDPDFEWAGTKPQLSLPQAIIEELSDLSSDSEHEDAEKLEDAQTPPATTVGSTSTTAQFWRSQHPHGDHPDLASNLPRRAWGRRPPRPNGITVCYFG
jgi:hypothetical protein